MISILLVDDDRSKIARIIDVLVNQALSRDQITVVQNVNDAKTQLTKVKFDLLILDVMLPVLAENTPSRKGGIELLEELLERDIFYRPAHVLGLTAYDDLRDEFHSRFSDQLWHLDHYDAGELGWADRLGARVRYLVKERSKEQPQHYGVDIAVVTALADPEFAAVKRLQWNWQEPEMIGDVNYIYKGTLQSADKHLSIVAGYAPVIGMISSALLAHQLIHNYRPRLLVMSGICAGIAGQCEIGDVLLADPTWDWQAGKYSSKEFLQAPEQISAPIPIRQRFLSLQGEPLITELFNKYEGTKPKIPPKCHAGPVASGSAVLADRNLVSDVKKQHRKLVGIEMELYGIYASGKYAPAPRPMTFGIKSVCDFGDRKKDDRYQKYASYMSASVLDLFCRRFGAELVAHIY